MTDQAIQLIAISPVVCDRFPPRPAHPEPKVLRDTKGDVSLAIFDMEISADYEITYGLPGITSLRIDDQADQIKLAMFGGEILDALRALAVKDAEAREQT